MLVITMININPDFETWKNVFNKYLWEINNSQTLEQLYVSFNEASRLLSQIVFMQLRIIIMQDIVEDDSESD